MCVCVHKHEYHNYLGDFSKKKFLSLLRSLVKRFVSTSEVMFYFHVTVILTSVQRQITNPDPPLYPERSSETRSDTFVLVCRYFQGYDEFVPKKGPCVSCTHCRSVVYR